MNTQDPNMIANEQFARLLYESVLPEEQKKEIINRMKKGEMSKEELVELYQYLVEEAEVRAEVMPEAMEAISEHVEQSARARMGNQS